MACKFDKEPPASITPPDWFPNLNFFAKLSITEFSISVKTGAVSLLSMLLFKDEEIKSPIIDIVVGNESICPR